MQNLTFRPDDEPAIAARSLSDDWYLKAYGIQESRQRYYGRKLVDSVTTWRNVSVAVLIGLCVGLGVAAVRTPRQIQAPVSLLTVAEHPPAQVALSPASSAVAPVNAPLPAKRETAVAANPAELERIKVRNRRLEALIAVLRQRKHAPEKRATPDPSNLFGQ